MPHVLYIKKQILTYMRVKIFVQQQTSIARNQNVLTPVPCPRLCLKNNQPHKRIQNQSLQHNSYLRLMAIVTDTPSYPKSEPLKITQLSQIHSMEATLISSQTMNISKYCHKNVTCPICFLCMPISPCLLFLRFCACSFHLAFLTLVLYPCPPHLACHC